jgi:hypothetical protein
MNSVIFASDFDITKLTYGEIKRMDNGGKMISVGYDNQPFVLQTCQCYAPFGLQCYQNDDGKAPSYSLDMSFKDMPIRKSLQELHNVFEQLDKKNIEMGMENHVQWLSKKNVKSTDVIEALYTSLIKVANDEKYPSTFKFKLPLKNGAISCDIFDKNHTNMDILSMDASKTKGSKCTAIIQCTGIWVAGGKFGMSWKGIQLKCCVRENLNIVMRHRPEDLITGEDIDEQTPPKQEMIKKHFDVKKEDEIETQEQDDTNEEDDDDEDDEIDEDDEEPVPVVSKKKK